MVRVVGRRGREPDSDAQALERHDAVEPRQGEGRRLDAHLLGEQVGVDLDQVAVLADRAVLDDARGRDDVLGDDPQQPPVVQVVGRGRQRLDHLALQVAVAEDAVLALEPRNRFLGDPSLAARLDAPER